MKNCDVGVLEPLVLGYLWEMKHFSSTNSAVVKDRLLSPMFSTNYGDSTVEWRLCLYPKSNREGNKDYLSIYLELVREHSAVTARIRIAVLDTKNNIYKRTVEGKLFTAGSKSWGFSQFIKCSFVLDEQNPALENDTLKIMCKIDFNPT